MISAQYISEVWIARHLIQVKNMRYTWLGAFLLVAINVDNMTLTISAIGEKELGHSPESTIKNAWQSTVVAKRKNEIPILYIQS